MDFEEKVLAWRGIERKEDVCPRCFGSGKVVYGNTTTWRGGIGGQVMTNDVCDECWGSGDITKKGANLRELVYTIEKLKRK